MITRGLPPAGADPTIVGDIRQAAARSGVDFRYLLAQASQESGFNPSARAAQSSAAGLYQFVDSTWLGLVRQYGAQYGVGGLARQITLDAQGRPQVADPNVREDILDLRGDAKLSADLAAEYAKSNKDAIESALGRSASGADLYLAHFLGPTGASQILKAIETNGSAKAADLLPEAAAANRSIFYDASGRARTVRDIFDTVAAKIDQKMAAFVDVAAPSAAPPPAPAGASTTLPASTPIPATAVALRAAALGSVLNTQMIDALDVVAYSALKLLAAPPADPAGRTQPGAAPKHDISV